MISWIPEGYVAIIEHFGKFHHIQEAGCYFYIPGIHTTKYLPNWGKAANKDGYLIEKSEQQTNTPTRFCQTKDNVTIKANTSIGWKIIDPKKAVYETDHLPTMISDLALNSLRANIGTLSLNDVFASRNVISEKISEELSATLSKWGVALSRVEIQELTYSEETAHAMMKEMIAEREKKANITLAQGESESAMLRARAAAQTIEMQAQANAKAIIIEAEANAKATELRANAECLYIKKLKEEIESLDAAKLLESDKLRHHLEIITQNPAHKVFMPLNTQHITHSNV